MPLELIIQKYGYLALFIGTFLEGETILILAGFAAHRGYLDFDLVWLIAFFGGVIGDQVYFFIGRFRGQALIARYPKLQRRVNRITPYLEKYQDYVLIGFRFIYGFRTVTPFAIGISRIGARRFFLFNMVSGVIWALIFAAAGYLFGHAAEALFGRVEEYEEYIFAGIIIAGIIFSLYHFLRSKHPDDG